MVKDFTKLTDKEAEQLFEQNVTSEIHSTGSISRILTRILMLEPCTWDVDFKYWTDDDKEYAKKLLKFLLEAYGFQDVKT
ncbi:hypothetical protein SLW70_09470 [Flavobacterium sp. NG2]|uniref:hypothetical protein n=1 Tax=Flavobacterium sp. NG2 TaxID=3097547 RepID=UPI002A832DEB|nr:hypothetical protein [Flavobacterium sp. NG2]WPR70179.1 hypothetical protein SLW70_09470 [Flavobacterium sp. NG2]